MPARVAGCRVQGPTSAGHYPVETLVSDNNLKFRDIVTENDNVTINLPYSTEVSVDPINQSCQVSTKVQIYSPPETTVAVATASNLDSRTNFPPVTTNKGFSILSPNANILP